MAVTKITCPECKTVLRPAKPVPAGKPVKCPECGNRFNAAEEEPEVPLKKPKKSAAAEAAAAERKPKKSAADKASPKKPGGDKAATAKKPAAKKSDDDDDDGGGGTYGFVDAHDEDEDKEDKPDIDYAPDMSTKDLRGPAASALVQPSNALIVTGALGFVGWLGLLVLILIPTLFPVDVDDGDKTKPPKPAVRIEQGLAAISAGQTVPDEPKGDSSKKSFYSFFGLDVSVVGLLSWYLFILSLLPIILGMVYSAIVTFGAVQIQQLEGYGWGMASCIMAMIPLNSFGFIVTTTILFSFLLGMATDDLKFLYGVLGFLDGITVLAGVGVGVWVLLTLMSDKVVAGYEYKAE